MDIVVAGFGRMGRHHHRIAGELGHRVVAVVDPVAEDSATPLRRDWQGVPDADLAVIATPSAFHEESALQAIERGMNVLIEKPLAPTPEACARIAGAASNAGVTAAVGHVERFNAAFMAYEPGDVRHASAQRWSPRPERITDVGVTMDIGIHDLDLCRALIGDATVSAHSIQCIDADVDTAMQATLSGPHGTAVVDASWHAPAARRSLDIIEYDRLVHLDLLHGTVDTGDGPMAQGVPEGETALHRQLEDVIRAIETRTAPTVDLAAGQAAVELAHTIVS